MVYIIESKGEHRSGHPQTQYKQKVLEVMTEQHRTNKVQRYQQKELPFLKINEKAEFHLVEENKAEEKLRNLFK
jgi:type III restriction enzyme